MSLEDTFYKYQQEGCCVGIWGNLLVDLLYPVCPITHVLVSETLIITDRLSWGKSLSTPCNREPFLCQSQACISGWYSKTRLQGTPQYPREYVPMTGSLCAGSLDNLGEIGHSSEKTSPDQRVSSHRSVPCRQVLLYEVVLLNLSCSQLSRNCYLVIQGWNLLLVIYKCLGQYNEASCHGLGRSNALDHRALDHGLGVRHWTTEHWIMV